MTGVPTAADVIPGVTGELFYFFPQPASGALMTLTSTSAGTAVFAAQTIELDIPAVNPGVGNVWQCSWLLGGTDALAF